MENSKIEWTDHTANFVIGCEKVSAGCAHCYAESMDARFKYGGSAHWGKHSNRYVRTDRALKETLDLDRKAKKEGRLRKVFINSMSDTFESRTDLDGARLGLFRAIQNTSNLIFLLLTKRPQNVLSMVPNHWAGKFPENVWIGTTIEEQKEEWRITELLKIPAKIRFLSVEPMLEPIFIDKFTWQMPEPLCANCPKDVDCECGFKTAKENGRPSINWVICGGESGPNKRPFNCDWARFLRDQCNDASVPFFMKQVDKVQPIPEDLMVRQFPV